MVTKEEDIDAFHGKPGERLIRMHIHFLIIFLRDMHCQDDNLSMDRLMDDPN